MRKTVLAGAGGLAAAFLGSLCCVGPILFVTFGVGAGLASTFEPLRPVFGVVMVALLAAGFWTVYGRETMRAAAVPRREDASVDCGPACSPVASCALPARRTRDVVILWTATLLALVFWTFPTWSLWLV